MTTQASIIINFFDDPEYCGDGENFCNYLYSGHCMIRIINPSAKLGLNKFLKLGVNHGTFSIKDPSCKFIWKKENKKQTVSRL